MTVPQKQCPRCSTPAPLEATFCGQCGRQYRTQFAPPAAGGAGGGFDLSGGGQASSVADGRTPAVWMIRTAQVAVALLVCVVVLAGSGVFRQNRKGSVPAVTSAPASPHEVAPPADVTAEARKALSEDPIESAARRAVDRESRRLDLPPPKVSEDGKIHLRSGGTISKEEWEAANRKAHESPILREPPKPPPF